MSDMERMLKKLTIPDKSVLLEKQEEEKWTEEEVIECLRTNLGFRIKLGTWDWSEDEEDDDT